MAREVQIILIDDLEGGEANETVVFGYNGEMLEVDLNEANANKLREAIRPFAAVARRHEAEKKPRPAGRKKPQANPENQKIREWALNNGYNIGEKGRVPQEIRTAYYESVAA